jgi:predicted CXXCH cytochrome family protein
VSQVPDAVAALSRHGRLRRIVRTFRASSQCRAAGFALVAISVVVLASVALSGSAAPPRPRLAAAVAGSALGIDGSDGSLLAGSLTAGGEVGALSLYGILLTGAPRLDAALQDASGDGPPADPSGGQKSAGAAKEDPAPAAPRDAKADAAKPAAPRPARRGPEDKTRRDFSGDCLAGGCHARIADHEWVHAPVAVGACAVCHEAQGEVKDHDFRSTRPQENLCNFCHRAPEPTKFAHKAFSDAECGACHDPHGGSSRHLLISADAGQLCGGCHAPHDPSKPATTDPRAAPPLEVDSAFAHAPFAEKKCLDCHKAHQSDHENLLVEPERDLCLRCHPNVADGLGVAPHVHKPLETECRSCHSSHGADDKRLLRAPPQELCSSCHEEAAKKLTEGSSPHGFLGAEASCLTCHLGHSGPTKALVAAPIAETCQACHDQEIERREGGKLANVAAELAAGKFRHGPVADGDCGACHRAHSSPHASLLDAPYRAEFYQSFSEDAYALCFSCHDKRIITDEKTTMTSFRDGERNLHWVHVSRDKGRSCGVCHEPHASLQDHLIRESVPFGPGGWKLPIRFEASAKGGTCAAGCHQSLSYDKSQPPGAEKAHLLESARGGKIDSNPPKK